MQENYSQCIGSSTGFGGREDPSQHQGGRPRPTNFTIHIHPTQQLPNQFVRHILGNMRIFVTVNWIIGPGSSVLSTMLQSVALSD